MTGSLQSVSTDARLPDGAWRGFYTYRDSEVRHRMTLHLRFPQGKVRGTGVDGVGDFRVRGTYDAETGEVWFTKRYVRCGCCGDEGHEVFYRGFADMNGIWGQWELTGGLGGFRIWPGPREGDHVDATGIEEEATVEEPRLIVVGPISGVAGGGVI